MKKAFDLMSDSEFSESVWKLYNNIVQLSGITSKRPNLKKLQNFDEILNLKDSSSQFGTPKGNISN